MTLFIITKVYCPDGLNDIYVLIVFQISQKDVNRFQMVCSYFIHYVRTDIFSHTLVNLMTG